MGTVISYSYFINLDCMGIIWALFMEKIVFSNNLAMVDSTILEEPIMIVFWV